MMTPPGPEPLRVRLLGVPDKRDHQFLTTRTRNDKKAKPETTAMVAVLLLTFLSLLSPAYQQADQVTSRFNRAVELQRQGAWKEAADEYRAVLALVPGYAEARANLGVVLSRLGDYENAIASYEAALRLNPELTPILLNLGIAHYRAGQFARAAETLERFLAISPNHIQARQLLGISLVELGREREAVSHLEATFSAAPDDVTVLYSLGMAYLRLGRLELDSIVQRLTARPDGAALARLLQGQARLESLEIEKAATDLEAAEKLSPDLPRLQFLLGLAYFKLEKSADAKVRFERELVRVPTDFLTLYYLALTLQRQGDLNGARQRIGAALSQEPQSAEALTLMGTILLKQGQANEAARLLEQAIVRQPLNSEAHYQLARSYQKAGRKQEAAREFAEVERIKAQEREREKEPRRNP